MKRLSQPAELQFEKLTIETMRAEQLRMRPFLYDPATVEDEDAVGPLHRGEPMGDDERGAAAEQVVQRRLQQVLGARIQGRSGLVKDQDAWIAEQRPRNGQALFLALRQLDSALADARVKPMRQLLDELPGVRGARRGHELGFGGAVTTERDVVADGRREQERVLKHDADLAPHAG